MSGIAGIAQAGKTNLVETMLDKISHRGEAGQKVLDEKTATMGIVWTEPQAEAEKSLKKKFEARDQAKSGHLACAKIEDEDLVLIRDEIGVAPLYQGHNTQGILCFASEVKALIDICTNIKEIPPGSKVVDNQVESYFELEKKKSLADDPDIIAGELRTRLDESVGKRIEMGGEIGAWLSGGLDSSTMVALARPHLDRFPTFCAGVPGAPDLEFAREVADYIHTDHHEVLVGFQDLLDILPDVIFYLESFDPLLIRSSLMNFLVAKKASEYVDAVFSGEGGDELFAGYSYLKSIDKKMLADELIDITARLHNTALQRVDRSASAHGTVAHVGFLDPEVVDYALRIPVEYKLRDGIEKWILRKAMQGRLPESVLRRDKAKFWEGAGVEDLIADHAEKNISDSEFQNERKLPNGWILNSKEELMYYRIFKDHFGELRDLSWMGRTKSVTEQ
ncbi:MAG: asparagine synthase [Candidatus Aminicenantes bacterium]|nr:asparagine synthase [Candidatus Aminicenantes bacterium]